MKSNRLTFKQFFIGKQPIGRLAFFYMILVGIGFYLNMMALTLYRGTPSWLGLVLILLLLSGYVYWTVKSARRLHDLNHPTWFCLFFFVPIAGFILTLYCLFSKSKASKANPTIAKLNWKLHLLTPIYLLASIILFIAMPNKLFWETHYNTYYSVDFPETPVKIRNSEISTSLNYTSKTLSLESKYINLSNIKAAAPRNKFITHNKTSFLLMKQNEFVKKFILPKKQKYTVISDTSKIEHEDNIYSREIKISTESHRIKEYINYKILEKNNIIYEIKATSKNKNPYNRLTSTNQFIQSFQLNDSKQMISG